MPELFFDTEIVSLELTGTTDLPLGAAAAPITTGVTLTRATDHNSSRSNKTSSSAAPQDPNDADDVDPDDLNGQTFDLFSTYEIEFDLAFEDLDPVVDFAQQLGDTPRANTAEPALISLEEASTFVFDRDAPDFGMLSTAGPQGARRNHGHVTVLKIAFGGGGGDIDLAADGMVIRAVEGSGVYTPLADGRLEHRYAVTASLTGTYQGAPFVIPESAFSGFVIERGQLLNNVIPEPSAAVLALLMAGGLAARRR